VSDWEGPLDALRWHWGGAYLISFFEPDNWVAQRRDDRSVLRSDSAAELREKILADYTARPVSRQVASGAGQPETPSCRLLPEG
jgi:hypothetical protein